MQKVKKLIAILFFSFYGGNTIALSVNYHYCDGRLAVISFLNFPEKKSCGCGPENMPKDDCCKDELKFQKNDNHRIIPPNDVTVAEISSTGIASPYRYFVPGKDRCRLAYKNFEIRRGFQEPIFLFCRVFKI
jgi:hypothetical protein